MFVERLSVQHLFTYFTFYIMKKLSFVFAVAVAFVLMGCSQAPMSDADMATHYGMTMEEFQEQKEAAARMNMSIEDHMKHSIPGHFEDMDHSQMSH